MTALPPKGGWRRAALAGCLVLATAACGTTQIVTNDPSARIYVDGVMVGKGTAEITKRGTPEEAEIVVKTADGREAKRFIDREMTAGTWLMCLFTYAIGCFVYQSYPDTVTVLLPEKAEGGWEGGDVWSQPPPGWQPEPASTTTPPAPGAVPAEAENPAPAPATTPAPAPAGSSAPAPAPAEKPAPAPAEKPAPQTSDPWQQPPS